MDDPRSGLWSHVVRLLAEHRPAWFIGENVPGLLSVNDGRDFSTVVHDLARLGYGFCWRVLDARHFGVPQRRRRVVIVGRLGDTGVAAAKVLLEPEGVPGDPAAGIEPRTWHTERTAGRLGGLRYAPDVANSLMAHGGNDKHDPTMMTYVAFSENQRGELVTVVRRLTPVECERLQGYPDNWTEGQADTHRSKQLGNSVAVPVFEWVGRRLVAVDREVA
jgi:DNA (cytosine-5)-methyltransferase 1